MSSPATSDYPSLTLEVDVTTGPLTAASTWTDITAYLREGNVTLCGREQELSRFSAGTASFTLDNRDRRFDPLHAAGPYFGNLKPMRQIRLTVTWSAVTYAVGYFYVDGWPQSYPEVGMDSLVKITATDGFIVLGRALLPDSVWSYTVSGLVPSAQYRLGESAGTVMADSSGNMIHGRYEGGATFSHRESLPPYIDGDGAIEFDGVDDVGIAPLSIVPQSGPYSYALWLKMPDELPSVGTNYMMAVTCTSSFSKNDQRSFWLMLHFNTGFLIASNSEDDNVGTAPYSNVAMVAGRVYFVVATYSGTAGGLKLYIDGVLQSNRLTPAGGTDGSVKDTVYIGGTSGTGMVPWRGVIDEPTFWSSTELSAANVLDLYNAGANPWDDDTSGTRIGRLLDAGGWPAGLRDIDTGTSVLGPASLGGSLLEGCQLIEQTEAGLFYIDGAGVAVFVSRTNLRGETRFTTSNATFGDGAGEIPYSDIVTSGYDHISIFNAARVGRVGGTPQQYSDSTSVGEYGAIFASDETGLLMATDGEALDRAAAKVLRYKDPRFRIDSITLNPRAAPTTAWPQVLGRKIGDRVTVKRRPLNVGTVISQDCHVESITHTFMPLEWETTWSLGAVDPNELLYMQIGSGAARNQIGAKVGY